MPRVLITCPSTSRHVPTGFRLDRPTFRSLPEHFESAAPCRECGWAHRWLKREAWLEGESRLPGLPGRSVSAIANTFRSAVAG